MKPISDLEYLCTNLGALSGIPVRLYEGEKQIFYYSVIHLIRDPFVLDQEKAFGLQGDISYCQTSFFYYYGILHFGANRIVIGPTRQTPISRQDLKSIAFALGIAPGEIKEFISQMSLLTNFPLPTLLQTLAMVNFAITGKKASLESISIQESTQVTLREEMEKRQTSKTVEALEGRFSEPYNALDIENRMIDMVMRGDIGALKTFFRNFPAFRSGTTAQEPIRQSKNLFIVATTLVSRAAIRGGMDVTSALALSDSYIQRCELANDRETITNLNYLMVMDYAEKVAEIQFGQAPSKLLIEVSNYVQNHLSDPIKTNDIAASLYMGRSRLSTRFKEQTGLNLSDYVMSRKIGEAKRLLRYSEKPFISIAFYLGFSSQSHFTRVFKKYAGSTPSEYRQLHQHY